MPHKLFLSFVLAVSGVSTCFASELGKGYLRALLETDSAEIPAKFVVIDPLGRKSGRTLDGQLFREIPEGGMSRESIDDDVDGTPGPESLIFNVHEAINGAYKFIVTPTTAASFYLNIAAKDTSRNAIPGEVELRVFMEPGTPREFTATLNFSPGSTMAVVSGVTFAVLHASVRSAFSLGQIGDAKFVAQLDKILTEGEKALSEKSGKDEGRENKTEAVEKLREFIMKLEKVFKGAKSDSPDDGDKSAEDREKPLKRFVSESAFKSLKGDAETLIVTLEGKPGDGGKPHKRGEK